MHFERDESNDQQNSKKLQRKQNKEKLKFTERKEGTGRHCQHRGRWEDKTDAVQTIPCGPKKVLSQPKSHQLSSSSSSSSSSISYLIHHHQHNNQKSLHCDDCHQIMMIIVTIMVCCVDIHTGGGENTVMREPRQKCTVNNVCRADCIKYKYRDDKYNYRDKNKYLKQSISP